MAATPTPTPNMGFFGRPVPSTDDGTKQNIYDNNPFKDLEAITEVNNSHKITIVGQDNDSTVVGYSMQPITYSLNAEWGTSEGQVSSALQNLDKMLGADKNGVGLANTGYATKKYYKGGGDLTLNLQMRLYAVGTGPNPSTTFTYTAPRADGTAGTTEETGDVAAPTTPLAIQILKLKNMVLPKVSASYELKDIKYLSDVLNQGSDLAKAFSDGTTAGTDGNETTKGYKTDAEKQVDAAKEHKNSAEKIKDDATDKAQQAITKVKFAETGMAIGRHGKVFGDVLSKRLADLKTVGVELSNAPNQVAVSIGSWFNMTEMVMSNVSFTYSMASNLFGPIWCDVTIDLVSRQAMSSNSGNQLEVNGLFNNFDIFNPNTTYATIAKAAAATAKTEEA